MTSSSFIDPFREFQPPSIATTEEAMTRGLVVVDTNVLLDVYRFAAAARDELLGALEAADDRLWIPHQVALEFHRNRLAIIYSLGKTYDESLRPIEEIRDNTAAELSKRLTVLARRAALSNSETQEVQQAFLEGVNRAIEKLNSLRSNHGVPDDPLRDDPILARLTAIFDGKVGTGFGPNEIGPLKAEADQRFISKTPPGYKDVPDKDDPYGDFILWKEALREAKARSVPLLIVTRDEKEDWFWEVKGRTVGARPQLVEECFRESGQQLVLMRTQTFLVHARQYLSTTVSDATIDQAGSLPSSSETSISRPSRRKRRLVKFHAGTLDVLDEEIKRLDFEFGQLSVLHNELLHERNRLARHSSLTPTDQERITWFERDMLLSHRDLLNVRLQREEIQNLRQKVESSPRLGDNMIVPSELAEMLRGVLAKVEPRATENDADPED